jgi:hypothetical protein
MGETRPCRKSCAGRIAFVADAPGTPNVGVPRWIRINAKIFGADLILLLFCASFDK